MSKKKIGVWCLIRIALCVLFTSTIQRELFAPFLQNTQLSFVDPWSSWLNLTGRTDAFPYGYVMFFVFLPAILLNRILEYNSIELNFENLSICTLLIIEFYLYKLLKIFDLSTRGIWSWVAIFSPLPLYISYIHGQIDIIPAGLIAISAVYILRNSWGAAGIFIGLALASKFSMVLVLPFFAIFFISKKSGLHDSLTFARGLMPGVTLFLLPVVFSQGYQVMVLNTPEVLKTLDARINVGVSTLFLVPIAYLMVVLGFWSLSYVSSFVLISYIGAAFSVIALTQTSSVGWFYWGVPLILISLRKASDRTLFLFLFWQSSVSFFYMSKEVQLSTRTMGIIQFGILGNNVFEGLLFTFNIVVGAVLILKILQEALKVGDIYSLSKKPLSLSIAGDSGVGKDTLSNEVARLFGGFNVALLLGDDYHLHERGASSWLTTTHLSTNANDLDAMGRDFSKLINGGQVFVKHYDHHTGRFTLPRKINSTQVIIVNGLHAHLFPGSEIADLKIFLSMEEELRIYLKLKRDLIQRQHNDEKAIRKSILARVPHYEKFVYPQVKNSDLHFHLKLNSSSPFGLGVVLSSRDSAFVHEIRNLFNAVLDIPSILGRCGDLITLEIDPLHFTNADAILILKTNIESQEQLFPHEPRFSDGSVGVLGLISLLALTRKRKKNV